MTLINKENGKTLVSMGADSFRYNYSDITNQSYITFGEHRLATMYGKVSEESMLSFIDSIWSLEENSFKNADDLYKLLNIATGFMLNGKKAESCAITNRSSIPVLSDGSIASSSVIIELSLFGASYTYSAEFLYKCYFDIETLEIKSNDRTVIQILTSKFAKKALSFKSQ